MDTSMLTDTLSLLVPYLQAGKQVLVDQLDQGLKTVIPAITKNVYDSVKKFFSRETMSKKTLERAEEKPDEENINAVKNMMKVALEDESFRKEIEYILKKLYEDSKQPKEELSKKIDSYSKKVKQYTMSNITAHGSTIIQGDGNTVR